MEKTSALPAAKHAQNQLLIAGLAAAEKKTTEISVPPAAKHVRKKTSAPNAAGQLTEMLRFVPDAEPGCSKDTADEQCTDLSMSAMRRATGF